MRFRSLLATSVLLLQTVAFASLDTASQQLVAATGGAVQACPPEYKKGICVRVEGGIVSVAATITDALPDLIPGLWRAGPEQGMSADVPSENAVLHLLLRGEERSLAVLQPKGAAAPTVTSPDADTLMGVVIENPENNYVVVLDSSNKPVRDLTTVRDGTYTVIISNYGRRTQTQRVTVGADGLKKFVVPKLIAAAPAPKTVHLVLPTAPGYIFLVAAANRTIITDLSALQPGYYDIFSYKDGEAGPMAGMQFIQLGQVMRPQFNGAFIGGNTTRPAAVQSASSSYSVPSTTGGRCWVSGYTRQNGTYVSGYYRDC